MLLFSAVCEAISTKNGDMEKNSFVSFSDYFDKLRHKAREIDMGIDKLTETWKMPQLLIGGYAERTDETDACLDELSRSLEDTNVSFLLEIIIQCYEMKIIVYMQNKKFK